MENLKKYIQGKLKKCNQKIKATKAKRRELKQQLGIQKAAKETYQGILKDLEND